MDSIQRLWEEHSRLVSALFIVVLILFVGFTASTLNNIALGGMQAQSAGYDRGAVETSASGSTSLSADHPGPRSEGDGTSSSTERKRIEKIYLDFEAPDVQEAVRSSKDMAGQFGGYSESEDFDRRDGETARVTVRIPEKNVSSFLSEVESKGAWDLESKDKNIDDVTDRYQELELELENKRQELNRLEELMNQTDEVDSLVKIQERMSELRSRIQYLDNQITDIDQQVSYTRIELSFEEPEPVTAEFDLRESFIQGYKGIFLSLKYIIIGSGYLLPFAALYAVYRAIKSYRSKE